jgi:hypothetical protein
MRYHIARGVTYRTKFAERSIYYVLMTWLAARFPKAGAAEYLVAALRYSLMDTSFVFLDMSAAYLTGFDKGKVLFLTTQTEIALCGSHK